MLTNDNVTIDVELRFRPDWPGQDLPCDEIVWDLATSPSDPGSVQPVPRSAVTLQEAQQGRP